MKFKGRITAVILVFIGNSFYIIHNYLIDVHIGMVEIIGLTIMLLVAWWGGRQFDAVKILKEKNELKNKEIEKSKKLFQAIFEKAPIGIAIIDKNGTPVISNGKLQELLGYNQVELSKMTFAEFSDPDDTEKNLKLLNELLEGKIDHYLLEKRYHRKDGQLVWGEVTSSLFPALYDDSYYVIGMVNDITERKIAEQKLIEAYEEMEYLSNRDGLTGIANRRFLNDYYLTEYVNSVRNNSPISLIMVDIDFFKQYNDIYGHLIGDKSLRQVAQVLEKLMIDSKGLVARYGGEEFIIVLPETDKKGAFYIANKICSAIEEIRIPHSGSSIHKYLTVSVGVSTVTIASKSSPERLFQEADLALYLAKQKGRNQCELYYEGDQKRLYS